MCSGVGNWALPQLGFPIRTSPDHSSVGSSPRLIAASYVLLRLLMPRHPPCALNNLTTKTRCSRPLCSSQFTGGPPRCSRCVPACAGRSPERGSRSRYGCPFPQDPTVCLGRSFPSSRFPRPNRQYLVVLDCFGLMVNDLPLSFPHGTIVRGGLWMLLRAPDAP